MSAEFRQRTPGEYAAMLTRKKWLIMLPVITFTLTVGVVVYRLPSLFESTSLLTVKPPKISDKVVTPLSDDDLSQRLQTINQEVLSRSSLEPLIIKHDLYRSERDSGMDMGLIIDKMRKYIVVDVEKSTDEKLSAFRIKFRGTSPQTARNVTAELASKYVNAQVSASTQTAEVTREFIDKELGQKKTVLDDLDRQRLEIMMKNVDALPESSQALIAQLQGLRSREDGFIKEKNALITERGRLNDQISSNIRQMRLIEDYGEKDAQDSARLAGSLEDTPAYGTLVQKRADLAAELDKMIKVRGFTDRHPDVIAKRDEIARVNDEIEALKKTAEKKSQAVTQSGVRAAELRKKNLEIENQRLQSQISMIDRQIAALTTDVDNNSKVIAGLEEKINTIPSVKVALEGITTQYQSAKQSYDDLLKKSNDANLQVSRATNAQGESIQIQDGANLPSTAVAPKRALLTAMGSAIGLAVGVLFVIFSELPTLFMVGSIADAKYYTGLPVLASVPQLYTATEKLDLEKKHKKKIAVGGLVAVGLVAPLAFLIELTRIFEKIM